MGSWPLWIGFNACVALLLLLDLGLFHRRPVVLSLGEAVFESAVWIALSLGFGAWILASHGRGPGLEFFTGYLVEKSLSVDNLLVFLLVFRYFRVELRFQHRLLYWGVIGAIVLRGLLIAAGAALLARFHWVLYVFGAFVVYTGIKLFGAGHAVHPERNPVVQWAQKYLPMARAATTQELFVRQGGRWLVTPLFLVVIVLETTDLVFATDSIPAVYGVTRDPFLVYSSNVCAILGLRALYFLVAGILPYFQYLDEGLAIAVMFIGGKMLAEPWLHVSTGTSLAIVGVVIALSMVVSVLRAKQQARTAEPRISNREHIVAPAVTPEIIQRLAHSDPAERALAAFRLFAAGKARVLGSLESWQEDEAFHALVVPERLDTSTPHQAPPARLTVGIAVLPETFENIRAANGAPLLADAPSDQDVLEYELEFSSSGIPAVHLDILTTKTPGGGGAIARYLEKFGEGVQQVELDVTDVDRGTEILRNRFKIEPIYPATRAGANGTRVNFFLVATPENQKVLVELVEQPKGLHPSQITRH
jgi:tellurite resistance protein TerC